MEDSEPKTLFGCLLSNDQVGFKKLLLDVDVQSHDFIVVVRYLIETYRHQLLKDVFEWTGKLTDYGDIKSLLLAAETTTDVFTLFEPLWDSKFTLENHPILNACASGALDNVKLIRKLLREGRLSLDVDEQVEQMAELKKRSIRLAARGGHTMVLMEICQTQEQIHDAVGIMVTNGHSRAVLRVIKHPAIDFAANNWELLRVCSLHVEVLMVLLRHHTVLDKQDELPADYYRVVASASQEMFDRDRERYHSEFERHVEKKSKHIIDSVEFPDKHGTIPLNMNEESIRDRYLQSIRTEGHKKDVYSNLKRLHSKKLDNKLNLHGLKTYRIEHH